MDDNAKVIGDLFAEIDELPYGPVERGLIDQAVQLADEAGLDELGYQARMRLVSSAKMTGDSEAVLTAFAWCVGRNAEDPVRFPSTVGANDMLWFHKWIAGTLSADPVFAAEVIEESLDQMEAAYVRAGVGLSGVKQARFWYDFESGRLDTAAERLAELKLTPRDEYSHCEACVRCEEAEFLFATGEDEAGLTLVDEMIAERLECGDEPEGAMSLALLPLLRVGRLDDARDLHYRGYRLARANQDNLGMVARHLTFLAVTGNPHRGLELLERHIRSLAQDGLDSAGHLAAATAIATICRAVDTAGHGDEPVRGSDAPELVRFFGETDGPLSARELADRCWTAAADLAARFDARNGNDFQVRTLERARELADARWDLPLDTTATPVVAVEPDQPSGVDGWFEHSVGLLAVGEPERSSAALDTANSLGPDPAQRVLIADHRLRLRMATETDPTAAHRNLITALREAGLVDRAEAEERHGELLHRKVTPDSGFSAEESAVLRTLAAEHPDARIRARALLQEARSADDRDDLVTSEQRYRAAAALLDDTDVDVHYGATMGLVVNRLRQEDRPGGLLAIETHLAVDDNPGRRAHLLRLRSQLLAQSGEFDTALADVDESLATTLRLGCHGIAAVTARLSAAISADMGNPDTVERWRLAVREAELGDTPIGPFRFGLAQALLESGHPHESAELLHELVDGTDPETDEEGRIAEYLVWLGLATRRTGDDSMAYGMLAQAVELAHRAEQPLVASQAGKELGALLFDHSDDECLTVLDRAVEDARSHEDGLRMLQETLHLRGRARCVHDDADGLDDLDEAARLVAEVAPWIHADITDSRARALAQLGRAEEAVPVGLQAADAFSTVGDPIAAGAATLFVGQILAEQGRDREAVVILAEVIPQVAQVPPLHHQACLVAGDCYERLGRLAEAAEVRSRIDG